MANDISVAIDGEPVKNGSLVVSTTVTGEYSVNDLSVKNTPTMNDIEDKYDNRFYNGIFVNIVGSGIIGV
ncbi:hypothetical protein EB001_06165 [bacterium]|nr:hypothetical protein [bacterium]